MSNILPESGSRSMIENHDGGIFDNREEEFASPGPMPPDQWEELILSLWRSGQGDEGLSAAGKAAEDPNVSASDLLTLYDRLVSEGAFYCIGPILSRVMISHPLDFERIGRGLRGMREVGQDQQAVSLARELGRLRADPRYKDHFVGPLAHMSAYYDGGVSQAVLPFQMLAPAANMDSDVIRTDRFGYRFTVMKDCSSFAPGHDPHGVGNCALIGNSTVFGVGATSDRTTLCSLMSSEEYRFYNFGLRAAALTQNLVAFSTAFSSLPKLREIVVIGGWIEFAAAHFIKILPRNLGGYFGWSRLDSQLNPMLHHLSAADWPPMVAPHFADPNLDATARVDLAVGHVTGMIAAFAALSRGKGANFSFVLQPIAEWIDRSVPAEEADCARILNDAPEQQTDLHAFSLRHHARFAKQIRENCLALGVSFVDANQLLSASPRRDEWLFAGRAHLMDLGGEILAEAFNRVPLTEQRPSSLLSWLKNRFRLRY